ncbi:MAG: TatD family hydrolase [Verrucomicrobia bacterium]|nr:TatD family hydrolase [Verrucomicrobiota bacterium]
MTPIVYDTHAHLNDPRFNDDLPAVIARAAEAGITRIVCVGTDAENSRRALRLAEQFPAVYAAVGWHPTHVLEAPDDVRPLLRPLAQHPKVVAIGETGLDHFHAPESRAGGSGMGWDEYKRRQARLFQQHLELAAELGLNVVVHHRRALDDCLALMAPLADRVRGQFHCFEDDAAAAQRVLALGSLVSFTGLLTYKNKIAARAALAATPLERFMLETDSPYLVPEPHRGPVKRCEPAFVRDTAALAAQLKGCSLDTLAKATCQTAAEFFPKLRRG